MTATSYALYTTSKTTLDYNNFRSVHKRPKRCYTTPSVTQYLLYFWPMLYNPSRTTLKYVFFHTQQSLQAETTVI